MGKTVSLAVCLAVLLATMVSVAAAGTIVLKSGNAAIGSPDPCTTVYREDPISPVVQAIVVAPHPAWISPPTGAAWVSTSSSRTDIGGYYIYDTAFWLPSNVSEASMSLTWSGDDGAWVNLGGSWYLGTGESLRSLAFDNAGWLVPGENHLTFHVNNANIGSNPTGLCYSATVNYTVPEPNSILALLLGITGLASRMLRRRRA